MLMFFPLMTLMADAARVIEIRLWMMALGTSTPAEMFLMVSEKMNAMEEAKAIIARGGNPALVIENYRKIVAANVARCQAIRASDHRVLSNDFWPATACAALASFSSPGHSFTLTLFDDCHNTRKPWAMNWVLVRP